MEIRFPVVALAFAGVAVALAVRAHFNRMRMTELRAFELGRQSVTDSNKPSGVNSASFGLYVRERTTNNATS
jgi:hypothetical protein